MTTTCHYLIRYGRPGFVGRFATASAYLCGDRVVVRGPRGIECGEVLVAPDSSSVEADGDVVRAATPADDAEARRFDSRGGELLVLAEARAAELGLPLAFVDVEVTLDGVAILHALPWAACDATALLDELAARVGFAVRLLDLARVPATKDPAEAGCGKPGCGSESGGGCSSCGTGAKTGGGCSTGSCSKGAVKSAEELTAYFSDLRQKMEGAGLVRTPLN